MRPESIALEKAGDIRVLAVSTDGKHIVGGDGSDTTCVWSTDTSACLHVFNAYGGGATRSISITPDSEYAVLGCDNSTVQSWLILGGDNDCVEERTSVALSPDGTLIAMADTFGTIRLHRLGDGGEIMRVWHEVSGAHAIAISPDNKYLVAGGSSGRPICMWSIEHGNQVFEFEGPWGGAECVRITPDGERIVAAGHYEPPKVWSVETGDELVARVGLDTIRPDFIVSADSEHMIARPTSSSLCVCSIKTGELVATKEIGRNNALSLASLPGGGGPGNVGALVGGQGGVVTSWTLK